MKKANVDKPSNEGLTLFSSFKSVLEKSLRFIGNTLLFLFLFCLFVFKYYDTIEPLQRIHQLLSAVDLPGPRGVKFLGSSGISRLRSWFTHTELAKTLAVSVSTSICGRSHHSLPHDQCTMITPSW